MPLRRIIGSDRDDALLGTEQAEQIEARGGNDTVSAGGGDDIIFGGAGNDLLLGEAGNDTINGGEGNDTLSGGSGNDILSGGNGIDSAVLSGSFADYNITTSLLGFTVTDQRTGASDGSDLIGSDIETLTFTDRVITLTTNNAPLALGDSLAFIEDVSPAITNVLANDFDFEALIGTQQLAVSAVSGDPAKVGIPVVLASGATITIGANGSVIYNQNGAFNHLPAGTTATDSVSYTVSDGAGGLASASFTIQILGTNDAAVIAGTSSAIVTEDAAATLTATGILTIADVDTGQAAFAPQTAQGAYGTFTLSANGGWSYVAGNSQAAIQNLGDGKTLTDSFTAVSVDGSASQLVTVTIAGTNDAAVIAGTSSATLAEDAAATLTAAGLLTIADVDTGEAAFAPQTAQGSYGTFTLFANGGWSYTASNSQAAIQGLGNGETLTDSFTAVSADGSASQLVSVTITGNGLDPIAANSIIRISASATPASISWAVSGIDPEDALSSFAATSAPQHASVSIAADGTYTLNVGPDFLGSDSFTFVATDADGQAGTGTVSLTVYNTDLATDAGGAGNDVFIAGSDANSIRGHGGNDLVRGGGGSDFLYGDGGNDVLYGEAGYDYLRGGDGNDYLDVGSDGGNVFGEDGDDTLVGGSEADYLNTGAGSDTVYANGGNDTVVLFGGEVGDAADGGDGSDALYYYADPGSSIMAVEDGALVVNGNAVGQHFEEFWLYGGIATDTISGGSTADHIYGGDGNDTLSGGAGSDRIYGDIGADILTGDSGSDCFIFRPGDGADQITDFMAGAGTEDVIDLLAFDSVVASAVVANATQIGSDTVLNFGGGQTLTLVGVDVTSLHADDFLFA